MPFTRLGPLEIALIVFVIVLLFGVTRLPQLGAGLGQSIKEFRRSVRDNADEQGGQTAQMQSQAAPDAPPPPERKEPVAQSEGQQRHTH